MSKQQTNGVYGLVLAGGESRRMGQDKAVLEREGESQLAYLAGVLQRTVEKTFVSTREEQRTEPERARFAQIVDRYDTRGPMAGILSAMDAYPEVDWLVVACDLPNIDAETLQVLLAAREEATANPFIAYKSSYDDLPEPLCAVYRCGSDRILKSFLADGVNCPRKVLIRSNSLLLEQPDPAALDNVNTPDDLQDSILKAAL